MTENPNPAASVMKSLINTGVVPAVVEFTICVDPAIGVSESCLYVKGV